MPALRGFAFLGQAAIGAQALPDGGPVAKSPPTSDIGAASPLPVPNAMGRGGDGPMAETTVKTRYDCPIRFEGDRIMAKTSPGEFFRQVRAEGGKIVWPSREETVRTSIFVAIMTVLLAVFFLGVDSIFGAIVRWLLEWV